jgi:dTDP-4-dehydrorhamnose 3,5-epimerase
MLPGVRVIDLKRNIDERGSFTEVMREDWSEFLGPERPVQANFSLSYPGMIRAWHRHERGQFDIFIVVRGALKICAYNDLGDPQKGELDEIVASGDRFQAVMIRGFYWHGTKCVSPTPAETIYFVTRLYDPKSPDELRRPWDDPTIVPTSINGNPRDPRAGKRWDWNSPPHK